MGAMNFTGGGDSPPSAPLAVLVTAVGLSFWVGDAFLVGRDGGTSTPLAPLILFALVGASLVAMGSVGLWEFLRHYAPATDAGQSRPAREHAVSPK